MAALWVCWGQLFFTADRLPGADDALVAGFPVRIIGFQGEACLEGKIQAGLVLKVDADVVIIRTGGKLHVFNQLAVSLREVKDPAVSILVVLGAQPPSAAFWF